MSVDVVRFPQLYFKYLMKLRNKKTEKAVETWGGVEVGGVEVGGCVFGNE